MSIPIRKAGDELSLHNLVHDRNIEDQASAGVDILPDEIIGSDILRRKGVPESGLSLRIKVPRRNVAMAIPDLLIIPIEFDFQGIIFSIDDLSVGVKPDKQGIGRDICLHFDSAQDFVAEGELRHGMGARRLAGIVIGLDVDRSREGRFKAPLVFRAHTEIIQSEVLRPAVPDIFGIDRQGDMLSALQVDLVAKREGITVHGLIHGKEIVRALDKYPSVDHIRMVEIDFKADGGFDGRQDFIGIGLRLGRAVIVDEGVFVLVRPHLAGVQCRVDLTIVDGNGSRKLEFLYFQMLTEAGVFDTIVMAVTKKLGKKMNVIVIMVLTTLIGGFSILTGNFTPAYLITFPILVPLYKEFDFDREAAFIIAQTAMSALCFIPWGIGMAYTASSTGLDANELAAASMPWGICFIPAIILQWVYFGWKHKKRVGTFQAVAAIDQVEKEIQENPNRRPKLFWINLVIFIICLIALGVFGIAPYLVFIVATVVTAMINFPKNFGEIFSKVGPMYLNILVMLIAINVYQAVFNNTGMVGALSDALLQVCPEFLLRYIHIIMLLLCVVIIYVIPFQIFNALYPVFISIGAGFGIPAVAVIAPFICNLSLATSSTPTNSSTYTGCALTETEVQHFCRKAVPIQTVTNAVVVLTAVIFGVLQL